MRIAARFEGVGLHSGMPVVATVHPGDRGIAFRFGATRTIATPGSVTDTRRCTKLGDVSTVEHLMSALAGLEITDAEVELTAPELPGMDGSARPFANGLVAAGFESLGEIDAPTPFRRTFVVEDGVKISVAKGDGRWRYVYDVGDRWPGEQSFEVTDVVAAYKEAIAPARTFALAEELPMIRQAGLGRGLDESSALVVGTDGYENAARFADEPARHKLLDAIGDLYLAGIPIRNLNVVAERSGHRTNVRAASSLLESIGEK